MARHRNTRPQIITVRPMVDRAGDEDVFGDAPVIVGDNRSDGFSVRGQVRWVRANLTMGEPGRSRNETAIIIFWSRDFVGAASGWEPRDGDLLELVSGHKLFVKDVQPTGELPIRVGRPRGGWAGYRVEATTRDPAQRAANSYD